MGPMYGFQWLHYGENYQGSKGSNGAKECLVYRGYDQLANCLRLLKTDPFSRRIMTSFNPIQASEGVLYPCHGIHIQFYVQMNKNLRRLCLYQSQRSADICCGVPFNVASYALLLHFMVNVLNNATDYKGPPFVPGLLHMTFVDLHMYQKHIPNAMRQMLRIPYRFPKLHIQHKMKHLTDVTFADLQLTNYVSHDPLTYTVFP